VTEHVNNSGVACVLFLFFFSDFSSLFPVEQFRVCMFVCMYVPQGLQLSVLFVGFFFLDDLHLLFELFGSMFARLLSLFFSSIVSSLVLVLLFPFRF